MEIKDMDNRETAEHLRKYVEKPHGAFSWPTDACGYDQHIKFVHHRNENLDRIKEMSEPEWKQFVLDYADSLTSLN